MMGEWLSSGGILILCAAMLSKVSAFSRNVLSHPLTRGHVWCQEPTNPLTAVEQRNGHGHTAFFWSSVVSKTKKIDAHTRSLECQVPDLGKIMEDLRNLLFHSNPSIISSTSVQYQWHAESFVNAFGQDLALAAIMVSGNETVTCLHWWITKIIVGINRIALPSLRNALQLM